MPTTINRGELQRLVRDRGAAVCEVLPHPEYAWAHLPGAIHLPLKSWDLAELPAASPAQGAVAHDGHHGDGVTRDVDAR